jgi:hypothetical protein
MPHSKRFEGVCFGYPLNVLLTDEISSIIHTLAPCRAFLGKIR